MELLTAGETAERLGVSDSTLRKWARKGRITRESAPNGQPFYRREDVERLLQEEAHWRAATGADRAEAGANGLDRNGPERTGTARPVTTGDDRSLPDSSPLNGHWHNLSQGAAGQGNPNDILAGGVWSSETSNHRAELAEQKAALLESEVQRQAEEIQHLRAQIDLRSHEIQQERTAGEQLRVMLMKLEATNAELAGALVVKALPPAPESVQPVKRAKWWQLWR
jgi:DNA-binding transcriptional MerR regulator